MVLAAAVCAGGSCSGKATAKLTLTPRKGRKRSYSFTIARSLKLADRGATQLRLKLSRTDRKRIDAARKAALTLTVTERHAARQPRLHTDDVIASPTRSTAIVAASHSNPSGSVNGPASLPIASRCEPLPSCATPASLASARRP